MENHQGPVKYKEFQQNSERFTDTTDNDDCRNQVKEESGENVDEYLETVQNSKNSVFQISESSKETIVNILDQIKNLSNLEKFLIFIKLNELISNTGDPLKQPLNPLGSRSEVCRTISWIKTHLEEDPEISLPKQQVYDEYSSYCSKIRMKPLSQADFGKVMKQVYPKVKARRLGTRGNSRYCYSGLRNCTKLRIPMLPSLEEDSSGNQLLYMQDDKKLLTQASLASTAWLIVKQWSESQLNATFNSIQALAFFLVIHCSVGVGSEAANQITSMSSSEAIEDSEASKSDQSHRDVQIQLQKKILQKEEATKDRKRKLQSNKKNSSGKKSRVSSTNELSSETSPSESSASSNTSPIEGKTICDKYQDYNNKPATLPDFNCFQKSVPTDESNMKEDSLVKMSASQTDLTRQTDIPSLKSIGTKYKTIQPKPLYQLCDNSMYNPLMAADNRSQNSEPISDKKKETDEFQTELPLSRERLNSISNVDKDAMDDYLGKNNSQHEEELSKYFNNENEIKQSCDDTSKISQLRQLLQENGLARNKMLNIEIGTTCEVTTSCQNSPLLDYTPVTLADNTLLQNLSGISSTARRRVSFDVVVPDETVPPSPNTRRKNFSFLPISPGPHSPTGNGRQSKCSSTSVSPFVSPRNTPVPRGRSYQNTGLTPQLLPVRKSCTNTSVKIKKELDLSSEIILEKDVGSTAKNSKKNFFALSAPPSPMLPNKSMLQALLNTSGKVSYTPNYIHQQKLKQDGSNEICQLMSTEPIVNLSENNNFRSQSVPLHQMVPDKTSFLLSETEFLPSLSQDDFNDLDTIGEDEKLGVTNIINSLNDQVYNNNNVDILSIDGKCSLVQDNLKDDIILSANFPKALPCRNLGRSQSIDVINFDHKNILSRSVPSTPLPFLHLTQSNEDIVIQNSHSYPSTPLIADDSFNYNVGDCLLNGQPIKSDELSQVYDETYVTFSDLNGDNSLVLESEDNVHYMDKTSVSSDQNFNIRIN